MRNAEPALSIKDGSSKYNLLCSLRSLQHACLLDEGKKNQCYTTNDGL